MAELRSSAAAAAAAAAALTKRRRLLVKVHKYLNDPDAGGRSSAFEKVSFTPLKSHSYT